MGFGRLGQVLEYLGRRMGLWLSTSAFLHDIAQARRSPIGTAALRGCIYFCLVACLLSYTSIGGCFGLLETDMGFVSGGIFVLLATRPPRSVATHHHTLLDLIHTPSKI